ncbi:MAG TPA: hypothetical protein VG672_09955 [Bryobacteraceae bacterium]|jgi:hypothetical protein|nr:hypothetical protein [Bryobacteraceae bacterium]
MGECSTKGWLPIEIFFDEQPAVTPHALVRWMEFGAAPLAEPFFEQTVSNLRSATPPAREVDTDMDTVVRISSRLSPVSPAGFIFHVSHCGSTLLANVLKTAGGTTVVSESRPVTSLLRSYGEPPGHYLKDRWSRTQQTLLRSLMALYAHYRTGEPEQLVLKLTSVDLLSMQVVRACWPDVPCVVVVRDPAEVIVANLRGGWWLEVKSNPRLAREIFGWEASSCAPEEMSDEDYCGRILGQYLTSALAAVDETCKVIDYEDLNTRRIRDIAEFFQVQLPPDRQKVDGMFGRYSKDPSGQMQFRDDRALKRKLATPAVIRATQQWAMPAYSELRGKGFW